MDMVLTIALQSYAGKVCRTGAKVRVGGDWSMFALPGLFARTTVQQVVLQNELPKATSGICTWERNFGGRPESRSFMMPPACVVRQDVPVILRFSRRLSDYCAESDKARLAIMCSERIRPSVTVIFWSPAFFQLRVWRSCIFAATLHHHITSNWPNRFGTANPN